MTTKKEYLAAKARYHRAGEAYRKKHTKETAAKYQQSYKDYIDIGAAYAEGH